MEVFAPPGANAFFYLFDILNLGQLWYTKVYRPKHKDRCVQKFRQNDKIAILLYTYLYVKFRIFVNVKISLHNSIPM